MKSAVLLYRLLFIKLYMSAYFFVSSLLTLRLNAMNLLKLMLVFVLSANFNAGFAQNGSDVCPIKNSSEIPKVTVFDTTGAQVDLHKYIGDRKVVLVFYRGAWCPYCTRHLSALYEVKDEMDSLGYELIAITPDAFNRLDSAEVRSEASGFTLFSDSGFEAINEFGIGWSVSDELYEKYKDKYELDLEAWSGSTTHILPVPAVFVVKDGVIRYQHVDPNYSQRLSPNVLLEFLKD